MEGELMTREEALREIERLNSYVKEIGTKETSIVIKSILGRLLFKSTKKTIKEAVEEASFRGENLIEADLHKADLREANLRGADLHKADLREANLRGADLHKADLIGADLRGADLIGANLSEANLSGANLGEADLRGANLIGVELNRAKFYGKGGTAKLKKSQVETFLSALGFVVVD